MPRRRILATYRLQLTPEFGLDDAANLVDYLAALGVSHVYCSPYLQAAPGSTHGYDVVDPQRVNEELGGLEAHTRFREALRNNDLGQILDIVPNHMAIGTSTNRWWWDVLENGPSSRYAAYFDVDWDAPEERFRNVILLPVLGQPYGIALESGELQVGRDGRKFVIRYFEHSFPVAPRSLELVLSAAAQRAKSESLAFLADSFGRLPSPQATDHDSVERRHRDKEILQRLLARLLAEEETAAEAVDTAVAELNNDPAAMHQLLERQLYRLAFWRMAGRDLGYRRFFDINTLIGLRVEDPRVFSDTHALILGWLADGTLDGVRIDHVDGLRDPAEYLQRLRRAAPQAWIGVEKILEPGESLPESWPDDGTTGYDFLNLATGVLIDPDAEGALTDFYAELTGEPADFDTVARESKRLALSDLLGSDLHRLAVLFVETCERRPRYRDYSLAEAEQVLHETIVCFPVYRTYARPEALSDTDADTISRTVARAKESRPDLPADLFDFLGEVLRLQATGTLETELALRFQQTTGPAMAKGVEDTAFYRFHRLICLNEVGGNPAQFAVLPAEFHRACERMQQRRPSTLLATSTHDTKRSDDVRARLALLSEVPQRWIDTVRRWSEHNERHRRNGLPDRNAEYLLYQSLAGAWPIGSERAAAYMEKAAREAKAHTSWTRQNPEYEAALRAFVESVLADGEFVSEIERFVAPLIEPGRVTSLAQTLLKLAAPGVPDIYRGSELWDFSLVDPDNRRPVDWKVRRRLLEELNDLDVEQIVRRSDEGLPKLWLIRQALHLRRRMPDVFGAGGAYGAIDVAGGRARHAIAFTRGDRVAVIVPRLVIGLDGRWEDTSITLPPARWHNELTGESGGGGRLHLAELLARFPVALLSREEKDQ